MNGLRYVERETGRFFSFRAFESHAHVTLQGRNEDAEGHNRFDHIPAVFALIRKDWKYFFWPQTQYEQLFHIEKDKYEEWDLKNSTQQTTQEALFFMRKRYKFMKEWAQSGKPV